MISLSLAFLRAVRTAGLALAVVSSACAGGDVAQTAALVDTLPGGAVRVQSRAEGLWAIEGSEPWQLVEELRIGRIDGEAPYVFGRIGSVIPDALGRIWVLDSQAYELRLFDVDGTFVRSVGRQGEGPGEFGGFTGPCAFPAPNGEILVEDRMRRWQRFDTAGVLVGAQTSTSTLGCGNRLLTADGRFMVINTRRDPASPIPTSAYYVIHHADSAGQLVPGDTIQVPVIPEVPRVTWVSADGRGRIISAPPFWPLGMGVLGADGNFWVFDGGASYVMRRETTTGDTLLIMERPYEPVPIADSIRDAAIRDFQRDGYTAENGFDPDQVPRVYPPFDQLMIATDGTLWVQRTIAGGAQALDVFSAEGQYLGQAETPADFSRISIRHLATDKIYGVFRDELDVQYVVRLGIRKLGG